MIYTLLGYVFTAILFILGIWSLLIGLFNKKVNEDTKLGLFGLFIFSMFSSMFVAHLTGI